MGSETPNARPLPLAGVKIADFSRLLPGAYCTWLLANLGADVIKIEEPGRGDYQRDLGLQADDRGSAMFQHVNKGKRSLALNLKDPVTRPILERLIATSDVIVESFRPGVAKRLGLDFDRIVEGRPEVVCASISGYGANSPLRNVAAHDINYIAFSGALARPLKNGDGIPELPLVDLVGGGLVPALSILSLLFRARATGQGGVVDAGMADAIPIWPNDVLSAALLGLPEPDRATSPYSGSAANYSAYALKDGHVVVGAVEPQFWAEFCRIMEIGNADDPDLRKLIKQRFASMTRAQVDELFAGSDTCVSLVNSYEQMLESDHARVREFVRPAREPEAFPTIASPFLHDGERLFAEGPAPILGEQTREVLAELGFSDVETASFLSHITGPVVGSRDV